MVSIPEGLPAWAQGVITIMVLVGFGFGIWRAAVKPGDAPSSATVISATVNRWDGRETAQRIELHVGRDLQFIRINGTVVGGLVGLLIHALSDLI